MRTRRRCVFRRRRSVYWTSSRLLYADKEVFLRELVSNASDALEKARHDALRSGADPGALEIKITTDDEDGKTLIVEDDGFAMTRDELAGKFGNHREERK